MRPIKRVIVHITDSPNDRDPKTPGDQDDGAKEIGLWHRQQGWKEIGYHWVVRRSGAIEKGRDEAKIGAHTKYNNADSLGIVYVGKDKPTDVQYEALVGLIVDRCFVHKISADNVFGHCEFDARKQCPRLHLAKLRADVRAKMEIAK